jgi:polysaccharide biosynthesis protein PslH
VQAGYVSDVRSVLASAAASVAPIRSGGGTRLKIIESMALRTPVVATSKAVEGLDVRDGEHVLIADTKVDFARQAISILQNPLYAAEIAENAYKLVRARYNWRVVLPHFMQLIDQAVLA